MREVDIIIIGGGPAGLSAAISCKREGIDNLLLIEREDRLGGILNQCIHSGFGLEIFKEDLTGPEYAKRYITEVERLHIPFMLKGNVLDISQDKEVVVVSPKGLFKLRAKAIILSMGCRERARGAIGIPGTRPAGIYTAGQAQNLMNIRNYMVGKRVVILGSGDIGLIMARRLTLEGARVLAVVEILPYCSGLPRNRVQCLEDFKIPLLLNHTIVDIKGDKRLKSVTISKVGKRGGIVPRQKREIPCDTLLLSCGLIPENELSRKAGVILDPETSGPIVNEELETNIPGIYACGNVLQVHDLVDWVTLEGEKVGKSAASYVKGGKRNYQWIDARAGSGIRYIIPHRISTERDVEVTLRVSRPGKDKDILVKDRNRLIKKVFFGKVNPSQMIKLRLNKKELRGTKALWVSLR
ncbi:MAG: NAD(P)/FAD-dependent oxidoreductase [bacterium]|nr:NAD(P)/FAD-dependent oxidoreductase [bacterium]